VLAARLRRPELPQHFLRSREFGRNLVDLMSIRPSELVMEAADAMSERVAAGLRGQGARKILPLRTRR